MPSKDRFLNRLRKKAKKGMRGWPVATIAFYGPNLSQATKVAVGIVPSETAEPREVRDWKVENGDVRADQAIAQEILDFTGLIAEAIKTAFMTHRRSRPRRRDILFTYPARRAALWPL